MRIGQVIGAVTLSRRHPSLQGARWRLVVPYTQDNLGDEAADRGEAIVVYDELSAGVNSLVAFSEGREAAQPFHPEEKPVDAYCAAVLDSIDISSSEASI